MIKSGSKDLSGMYNLIDYKVSVKNIIEIRTIRVSDDSTKVDLPVSKFPFNIIKALVFWVWGLFS